jgi:glycosyltransferase involved in cell wall biosynthesis
MNGSAQPRGEDPLRLAVVGVSGSRICGVRDHAALLSEALPNHGVIPSWHWLTREASSARGARAELAAWASALPAQLEQQRAQAVLLHYSVFSYAYRGFPVFVRPVLRELRASGLPVVTVLHEFVYPWRRGGVRGKGWALSQSAAMRGVMRSSAAVVVTAPFRAQWLAAQRWLARRPARLAPVFSNLPAPAPGADTRADDRAVVGLFGYGYEGAAVAIALEAMRMLGDGGPSPRLRLLGSPGAGSPAAERWLAGARERGIDGDLSFSGVLPAQELADELAACDVLLHLEPSGPTSRKGTLAASLASGTAVVAIDGPRRWPELTAAGAALVVEPTPNGLADGIAALLADEQRRRQLGARGSAFASSAMGVERSALVVTELVEELVGVAPRAWRPGGQPVAGRG